MHYGRRSFSAGMVAGAWSLAMGTSAAAPLVQLVVPFSPGGTTDALARLIGRAMSADLNAPVVVENRPGAAGAIGTSVVARSQPNGNTMLFGGVGSIIVLPFTQAGLTYKVERDLQPVANLCNVDFVLAVGAGSPYKSLGDVISAGKRTADGLTYASTGTLGSLHIAMAYLCKRAGVSMVHVPYKGENEAFIDLQQARADITPLSAAFAKPMVDQGKLRVLATISPNRILAFPNLPTVAESGYPGYAVPTWNGIFVAAGTPAKEVAGLEAASLASMKAPGLASQIQQMGVSPMAQTAAQFSAFLEEERQRWKAMIAESGVLTS